MAAAANANLVLAPKRPIISPEQQRATVVVLHGRRSLFPFLYIPRFRPGALDAQEYNENGLRSEKNEPSYFP